MNFESDDFELFKLPQTFAQRADQIDLRWREMQAEVHPDRFVTQGAAAQRVAMQWAVRVNEAYRRLKNPVSRAAYLCELQGVAVNAETDTAMPADFLKQQMEWREALDDASSIPFVESLQNEVEANFKKGLDDLRYLLDTARDPVAAAQQVRALMFVERFVADVDRRLEALGQ